MDLDAVVQPRSEEDQVRRSVFSRCLRLLATASADERIAWATDVHRINAAEAEKKQKKRPRESESDPTGCTAEHTSSLMPSAVVFSDEVTSPSDLNKLLTTASDGPEAAGAAWTAEEATAVVAAYMRQLLDRVVGLSLNNLSSAALGFLCVMLKISSKPPKGKDALYSLLANFHFQVCEKIGKRQVSNHTVLLHAQQDAAALAAIAGPKKGGPVVAGVAVKGKAKESKSLVDSSSDPLGSEVQTKTHNTKNAFADAKKKLTTHHSAAAPQPELGVQDDAAPVLRHTRTRTSARATVVPIGDADASPVLIDDETLQRKLMLLVRVLDPVTIDTLTRKLSDGGVGCDRARAEHALRVLAARGVIYYENGIAYFTG